MNKIVLYKKGFDVQEWINQDPEHRILFDEQYICNMLTPVTTTKIFFVKDVENWFLHEALAYGFEVIALYTSARYDKYKKYLESWNQTIDDYTYTLQIVGDELEINENLCGNLN